MSKRKQNHIHINGRHYDATTGEPLDGQPTPPRQAKPAITHHQSKPKAAKPVHRSAARRAANHAHPHAPRPAQTLMRHAVRPPRPASHPRVQANLSVPADITLEPKTSAKRIVEPRLRRSQRVRRSLLISHFGAGAIYAPAPPSKAESEARRQLTADHHRTATHRRKHVLRRHKPTTEDVLQKALDHASSFRELPVK